MSKATEKTDINLSHLEPALINEGFDSVELLIQLNDTDLDELCVPIKEYLQKNNSKLTLSQKAQFKRMVKEARNNNATGGFWRSCNPPNRVRENY